MTTAHGTSSRLGLGFLHLNLSLVEYRLVVSRQDSAAVVREAAFRRRHLQGMTRRCSQRSRGFPGDMTKGGFELLQVMRVVGSQDPSAACYQVV